MKSTYDGYAIAEQDLLQRGPGDFLGANANGVVRQSGGPAFRLADASEDTSLLTDATEDARQLLASDPTLAEHPLLEAYVSDMLDVQQGLIS